MNVGWIAAAVLAYLLFTQPRRASRQAPATTSDRRITAKTFPGGWNVSLPGTLAIGTGPGGTSVVLDPNSPLWKGLTTGVLPNVPEVAPPDSPIVMPPEFVPSMGMTSPSPDFGLPPDAAPSSVGVDPCLWDPTLCAPTDPSIFPLW